MMMTDLRGFTSLSERLPPERVVEILNRYLAAMVGIIKRYQGTIDEFIGDAIFVLFGAPVWQEDDAQRAVACAIAMQLAMEDVNAENRKLDLPEVEMGMGLDTGQVVLGNIGSPERMKYGVVGRHVNLTSRIQSYTTGGQILISEATRREAGTSLKIGKQTAIKAKGIEHPVTVCEVLGIGGRHRLHLTEANDVLASLAAAIPFTYALVEGSHFGGEVLSGHLMKLSSKQAEVKLDRQVPPFANLKMRVRDADGRELPGALYGKVLDPGAAGGSTTAIRFTSVSPEIEAFFVGVLAAPDQAQRPASPNGDRHAVHELGPKESPAHPALGIAAAAAPRHVTIASMEPLANSAQSDTANTSDVGMTGFGLKSDAPKKRGWLRSLQRP